MEPNAAVDTNLHSHPNMDGFWIVLSLLPRRDMGDFLDADGVGR
jgi:hypothetical protein